MKRTVVTAGLIIALSIPITGCWSSQSTKPQVESMSETQTVEVEGYSITVPSSFEVKDADNGKYIYPDFGGVIYIVDQDAISGSGTLSDVVDGIVNGAEKSGSISAKGKAIEENIGDARAFRIPIDYSNEDVTYRGWMQVIISGSNVATITAAIPKDLYSDHAEVIEDALDSIRLDNPQKPAWSDTTEVDGTSSSAKELSTTDNASNYSETVSQRNAVNKAKEYISYTAFSHDGLVQQLEFEKYSHDDAVYGADNCGADWSEQAARKAADYMSYSSFSRDGLIDQLVYEGFSQEEAAYGASSVGL